MNTLSDTVEFFSLEISTYSVKLGIPEPLFYVAADGLFFLLVIAFVWMRARSREAVTAVSSPLRAVEAAPTKEHAQSSSPTVVSESKEQPVSLKSGLEKTRTSFFSKLKQIFKADTSESEIYRSLEELLVTSDLGVRTSRKLLDEAKAGFGDGKLEETQFKSLLKGSIMSMLQGGEGEIKPKKREDGSPLVILVIGVNGAGKTTTIGKLASRFAGEGAKVLLAAADTFRAAAVEQIEVWANRANVEMVRGAEGAKPSTVAYEAIHKGRAENFDVVIIDTAGRLHTRVNLMNELGAVVKIIEREQPGAPHETLLVLDATTGQNALQQAREFNERAKLTGIVLTKLDGTPKGGIIVAIREELGIPVKYIGVGEKVLDLRPFNAGEFVEALFAD